MKKILFVLLVAGLFIGCQAPDALTEELYMVGVVLSNVSSSQTISFSQQEYVEINHSYDVLSRNQIQEVHWLFDTPLRTSFFGSYQYVYSPHTHNLRIAQDIQSPSAYEHNFSYDYIFASLHYNESDEESLLLFDSYYWVDANKNLSRVYGKYFVPTGVRVSEESAGVFDYPLVTQDTQMSAYWYDKKPHIAYWENNTLVRNESLGTSWLSSESISLQNNTLYVIDIQIPFGSELFTHMQAKAVFSTSHVNYTPPRLLALQVPSQYENHISASILASDDTQEIIVLARNDSGWQEIASYTSSQATVDEAFVAESLDLRIQLVDEYDNAQEYTFTNIAVSAKEPSLSASSNPEVLSAATMTSFEGSLDVQELNLANMVLHLLVNDVVVASSNTNQQGEFSFETRMPANLSEGDTVRLSTLSSGAYLPAIKEFSEQEFFAVDAAITDVSFASPLMAGDTTVNVTVANTGSQRVQANILLYESSTYEQAPLASETIFLDASEQVVVEMPVFLFANGLKNFTAQVVSFQDCSEAFWNCPRDQNPANNVLTSEVFVYGMDMDISLSAPNTVVNGSSFPVTITVEDTGTIALEEVEVRTRLLKSGFPIVNQTVLSVPRNSFAQTELSFPYTQDASGFVVSVNNSLTAQSDGESPRVLFDGRSILFEEVSDTYFVGEQDVSFVLVDAGLEETSSGMISVFVDDELQAEQEVVLSQRETNVSVPVTFLGSDESLKITFSNQSDTYEYVKDIDVLASGPHIQFPSLSVFKTSDDILTFNVTNIGTASLEDAKLYVYGPSGSIIYTTDLHQILIGESTQLSVPVSLPKREYYKHEFFILSDKYSSRTTRHVRSSFDAVSYAINSFDINSSPVLVNEDVEIVSSAINYGFVNAPSINASLFVNETLTHSRVSDGDSFIQESFVHSFSETGVYDIYVLFASEFDANPLHASRSKTVFVCEQEPLVIAYDVSSDIDLFVSTDTSYFLKPSTIDYWVDCGNYSQISLIAQADGFNKTTSFVLDNASPINVSSHLNNDYEVFITINTSMGEQIHSYVVDEQVFDGRVSDYAIHGCVNESESGCVEWSQLPEISFTQQSNNLTVLRAHSQNINVTSLRPLSQISTTDPLSVQGSVAPVFTSRSTDVEVSFQNLDVSRLKDDPELFSQAVNKSKNKISINTSLLSEAQTTSARLRFLDTGLSHPLLYRDGSLCPATVCYGVSFDSDNDKFLVNVTGFSTYELVEDPCPSGSCDDLSGGGGGGSSGGDASPPRFGPANESESVSQQSFIISLQAGGSLQSFVVDRLESSLDRFEFVLSQQTPRSSITVSSYETFIDNVTVYDGFSLRASPSITFSDGVMWVSVSNQWLADNNVSLEDVVVYVSDEQGYSPVSSFIANDQLVVDLDVFSSFVVGAQQPVTVSDEQEPANESSSQSQQNVAGQATTDSSSSPDDSSSIGLSSVLAGGSVLILVIAVVVVMASRSQVIGRKEPLPESFAALVSLGHSSIDDNNIERARSCYLKARKKYLSQQSDSEWAIRAHQELSDLYDKLRMY